MKHKRRYRWGFGTLLVVGLLLLAVGMVAAAEKTERAASEDLLQGPQLTKSGGEIQNDGTVEWTVTYTAPAAGYEGNNEIAEADRIKTPYSLLDELPEGMDYIAGSAEEDGAKVDTDRLKYDQDTHSLTYHLLEQLEAGKEVVLTYKTRLTDEYAYKMWTESKTMTFSNTVCGLDEQEKKITALEETATVTADSDWLSNHAGLSKTGTYKYENGERIASWTVTVNTLGREYEYLKVEDTLGKGLSLDTGSIKINDVGAESNTYNVITNDDKTTQVTLNLYKDKKELVAPDSAGKYTITYTTKISEDYFLGNEIGDADVKNGVKLLWKWGQKPEEDSDYPKEPSIQKEPVTPDGLNNDMLTCTGESYDPATHTLKWEVTVNPNEVDFVSAKFEDTLLPYDDGIVTAKDGQKYKLKLPGTEAELEKQIKGQLPGSSGEIIENFQPIKSKDGSRTIGFSFDIKDLGEKQFKFTVSAEIDAAFWSANQTEVRVQNNAVLKNVKIGQMQLGWELNTNGNVNASQTVLKKSSAGYDPDTKEVTWKLEINSDKVQGLKGVTITDTLPTGMDYVKESTKLDGVAQTDTNQFGAVSNRAITWEIGEDKMKDEDGNAVPITLEYKTHVDVNQASGDGSSFLQNDSVKYTNEAELKAKVEGAVPTSVTADAVIKNRLVEKICQEGEGNKVTYTVNFNPNGVKLSEDNANLSLKDIMPTGLVPDLESIELYKAKVTAKKTEDEDTYEPVMEKGEKELLEENELKYSLGENGGEICNVFEVPVEDETPYILVYDAYAIQTNVELVNTVSLKGPSVNTDLGQGSASYKLTSFDEEKMQLPDRNWSLRITNKDQNGKIITFTDANKAAKFGLYTEGEDGKKELLMQGQCNPGTGICIFSQPTQILEGVTKLYYKEIKTPDGYLSNEGFKEIGAEDRSKLKAGGTVELTHVNEQFGKIDVTVKYVSGEETITPNPAPELEFALYEDEACTTPVSKATSKNGTSCSFEDLKIGNTYYLKQTKDLEGFYTDSKPASVTAVAPDSEKTFKFIIQKTAMYTVKYYKQNLNGDYDEQMDDEQTNQGPAIVGTEVSVESSLKSYAGYTVNLGQSKSKLSGTVTDPDRGEGLVLKLYFDLNGSLKVTKKVEVRQGINDGDVREFHFQVKLSGTAVDNTEASDIDGTYGDMAFEKGVATFALANGESKTAGDLPPGFTYEVIETDANKYGYTTEVSSASETISGALASGTISKDAAEVTFTNEKNKNTGKLTVSKKVVGEPKTPNENFEFKVTLTTDTAINGTYGGMEFKDGVAEFTLGNGDSKTATDIPVGIGYKVEEKDANKNGYVTTATGASGTITEKGATATFINTNNSVPTPKTGDLIVSKIVAGNAGDTDRSFNFTVTLGDTSINGTYGNMEFKNGIAAITLKHGESKIAKDLPEGTGYTVIEKEADQDDYTTVSTGATGTIKEKGATAAFTNTKNSISEPETGNLTVSKTVAGNAGDTSRSFNFTVTLDNDSISGTYGDMEFKDGIAAITLKHGESKTAENLPEGTTYTVTEAEANQDGYTTDAAGASGTITEAGATATFTNTNNSVQTSKTGDLTVSKTVAGDAGDTGRSFNFTVTLGDTSINGTYGDMEFKDGIAAITLKHGESKTAKDLPAGTEYTVTEAEANQDGYTTVAAGENGTITEDGVSAAFVNTKENENNDPGGDDPEKEDPGSTTSPGEETDPGSTISPGEGADSDRTSGSNRKTQDAQIHGADESSAKAPVTGDDSLMLLWALMAGGSGMVAISALRSIKKRRRK